MRFNVFAAYLEILFFQHKLFQRKVEKQKQKISKNKMSDEVTTQLNLILETKQTKNNKYEIEYTMSIEYTSSFVSMPHYFIITSSISSLRSLLTIVLYSSLFACTHWE